jgi:HSP20 family protein
MSSFFEDIEKNLEESFWIPPWFRRWWRWPFQMSRLYRDTKLTSVDLVDTGKEYKIIAEMPGVDKKDVEVNVTPNAIDIYGETKTEIDLKEGGYLRRERSYSTLCRRLTFPEEVIPEKANAILKNGILEVTVPKRKPTKRGRKVPVR